MKTFIFISLFPALILFLSACGKQEPLTDADLAKKYNLTTEELKEQKAAAARMNMPIQDHLKSMDH